MMGIAQISPMPSGATVWAATKSTIVSRSSLPASVGDELPGDAIDARVAFSGTGRQLRQLEVVLAGQVLTDLTDLVLHDVVVVAQPVLGSDRLRIRARDRGEKPVRPIEALGARVEARQEWPPTVGIGCEGASACQRGRVCLQLIRPERCGKRWTGLPGFWLG